jgi:lipopolysaccharide export system protein LptA
MSWAWLCLIVGAWVAAGAEAPPAPKATNDLVILSEDGFEYNQATAIYRGNVHVTDGQMRLSCDRLVVTFQTNDTNQARIESIVAENNVVITQQQGRATGDLAIYTASNDVVVLIGRGVVQTPLGPYGNAILETPQGKLMGTNVVFDRKANRMWAPGRVFMQLRPDAFGAQGIGLLSTNAFDLPGSRRAPRSPGGAGPPERTQP